jgi:hypothetical protein
MAAKAGSTVNVCESHCYADQQVYGQADIPAPAIGPQPALIVRLATSDVPASFTGAPLALFVAAPPPHLRFVRFLI